MKILKMLMVKNKFDASG